MAEAGFSAVGLERLAFRFEAADIFENYEKEARFLPDLVARDLPAVDIGAARGYFTDRLLKLTSKVIAFEPNPNFFHRIQKFFPSVDARQIALSDTSGTATLRVPKGRAEQPGWGTIHTANDLSDAGAIDVAAYTVQTSSLDQQNLPRIGFLKMDVEGHELNVLRGAEGTLRKYRPAMLIEVSSAARGGAPKDVVTFLHSLNYAVLYLTDNDNLAALGEVTDAFESRNVICVPSQAA
jgi:FkbM family methyltransferase